MSRALLLAGLVALVPISAGAEVINQSNPINVVAVVRIGGGPVAVNQTGTANYAGVIQAGRTPSATINQSGNRVNSAVVGQLGRNMSANVYQHGGPRVLNSAAVSQHSGIVFHHR